MAVDGKRRVIVACLGEQADGFEGDAVEPLRELLPQASVRLDLRRFLGYGPRPTRRA